MLPRPEGVRVWSGHLVTVSPEYGQLPQAPELKLCIARTGGPIPAGGATERNLCPDQEQPLASRNSTR